MATEQGFNLISRYANFNVKFDNITRDGSGFSFSTIGSWIFALASGNVNGNLYSNPVILKSSTGVSSGDFSIDSVNKSVTVAVRPSEISYGYGQYYVSLIADTSGVRTRHLPKYITIVNDICPTGI